MNNVQAVFNNNITRLARTRIRLFQYYVPSFQVCGYTGLALAILLSLSLTIYQGLPALVMVGIIITAILTFFGLAFLTKIVTGKESLIYYHHEIAVMLTSAFVLWLLRQPILPYLDATILGIGIFLVCGRIGCLMAGCCHGKPHGWGVCYRQEHAQLGFPQYYTGMRLFPVQLLESVWVLVIVLAGCVAVIGRQPPGTALALYILLYDLGRFNFEFIRGDPARPYFKGFSEAQWISFLLVCVVIAAEFAGILPFHAWHVCVGVLFVLLMLLVVLRRRGRQGIEYRLQHPRHVREVAEALQQLRKQQPGTGKNVPVITTSQGIRLSAGWAEPGKVKHYTISSGNGTLTEAEAAILANLIIQLERAGDTYHLVPGKNGIYHILVDKTIEHADRQVQEHR